LFGIENITANNGWAMAVVGASTVFLGLVVLSFVISQIHKVLEIWEERGKHLKQKQPSPQTDNAKKILSSEPTAPSVPAVEDLITIYRPLVDQLKEPFNLVQLYEITKDMDLPHPHLSINRLREADILVAQGDGTFTWNKQKAN
jgi:hypothetical protein